MLWVLFIFMVLMSELAGIGDLVYEFSFDFFEKFLRREGMIVVWLLKTSVTRKSQKVCCLPYK